MQPTHQRRSRVPLSCEPCRTRKLKCNREKPCQNCTARDQSDACIFRGHKDATIPTSRRKGDGGAMRHRIDQLERLVQRLISERTSASTSDSERNTPKTLGASIGESESDLSAGTHSPATTGKTVVDGSHSIYHSGNDWHLVLQEIGELKNTLDQEKGHRTEYSFDHMQPSVDGTSLLFTQAAPIERLEILSTLPPRPEVDRLVSWFFDRQAFPITIPPILHEPTLRRELDDHWRDPSQANLIWAGLIFSILGITMLAYHQHGESLEYEGLSESLFQLYRTRTAQCLLRGDITKCLPYTVETLRLNATAELNRKDDNRRALWMTTGIIIRAAINMGYHRDPSLSSNFSAFQAEYRRRIWSSIISMDAMASFLLDFPRMMTPSYSDTREPLNLHDWELSENTVTLPPSRPLLEPTPVTYLIIKGRLLGTLSRVTDFNSRTRLGSYETVLDIDRALHQQLDDFPPQVKAILANDDTRAPQTAENFPTFSLLHMFLLGICKLHRQFMVRVREDARFQFSRERCVSSAVSLLTFQRGLDPGIYKVSQPRQTFALGAMLLFLELELRKDTSTNSEVLPDSDFLLQTLENSVAFWAEAMHACDETWDIYQLLVKLLAGSYKGMGKAFDHGQTPFGTMVDTTLPSGHLVDHDGASLLDVGTLDSNFDWATWDVFIEETNAGGPMY